MKSTKKFLKGASVLLIAAVMILSAVAVTANTITTKSVVTAKDTLLEEGFEEGTMPPSGGWYTDELNLVTPWTIVDAVTYPDFVHSGDYAAWINYDTPNPSDNWLFTPDIDLTGVDDATLTFWAESDTNWPTATMELHIQGDGFDDILWDMIADEVWADFIYREMTFDLSNYAGQVINISWRYVGQDGNSFGLDDVMVTAGGGPSPEADLDCAGSLSWTEIEPGAEVTGSFTVENSGDPETLLNWEIDSWPDWGTWTFTPASGTGLTPEDGAVTVDVVVVAPDEPETEFTGEVTIVNSDDSSDSCSIDAALATPLSVFSSAPAVTFINARSQNPQPATMLDWLQFDDGTNVDGIGLTAGGSFEWGIRLTPDELGPYDGLELTTVKFHHGPATTAQPEHSGNVYIYEAGTPTAPGAQIPTATTPWTHTGSDWVEITLAAPVVIDGSQDLWVTIDVTHLAGEYPAGCGPGPQVPGKGGWITLDGVAWDEISGFGLDYNWNLAAGVGGGSPTIPDLDCTGSLSWTEIEPGAEVTGEFTVENIGDPESMLNWEIDSVPDWGTWTFTPNGGTGLTPEDGEVTVEVVVVAPEDPETEFEGEIVLVNSNDAADTCTIDVSLATPVSVQTPLMMFFERLAERFPIIAMILEALF